MTPEFRSAVEPFLAQQAKKLSTGLREDFMQDMWVHLLDSKYERAWMESKTRSSYISLMLFRLKENWLEKMVRGRNRRMLSTDPADPVLNQRFELPLENIGEAMNHKKVLDVLLDAFKESCLKTGCFTHDEASIILDGFKNERTKKDIARSIGRSPQTFEYHFKRVLSHVPSVAV